MKPKVILLDWDGTIVDGFHLIHQAMNETLAHYDKPIWDDATAAVHVPRPDKEKFPEIFGEQSGEALKYFYNAMTRIGESIQKPDVIPGAENFMNYLQEARSKGVYVGIVSNSRTPAIERELKQLGWENYIDVIVASDSGVTNKPNKAAYDKALEHCPHTKLRPSEILYIGDANTDLEFARNTKMKFIGIGDKFTSPKEGSEYVPIHGSERVANLNDVVTRLKYAERNQTNYKE